MNEVILNPSDYKETYINYLNSCFPNWGNEVVYNWVFERQVGDNASDILLLKNEEGEVIAGSSITYRTVTTPNGLVVNFGIMTGSWTLPNARGKGCFSQIISESKRICFAKNVPYLTAFVTETNASYRRLKDAGFYCKIADNVFSNEDLFEIESSSNSLELVPVDVDLLYAKYQLISKEKSVFLYTKSEFELQYIQRINFVECAKVGTSYFLFEDTGSIIKLLFFSDFDSKTIQYFCNWIRINRAKKVMFFVSDEFQIDILEANNFNFVKGFYTIQKTDDNGLDDYEVFKKISINLGDKM